MSKTIIVSLISDQTIPNVLFIRNQPKVDHYLFISTEKMEQKGTVGNIIKACPGIEEISKTIVVGEDNLADFEKEINNSLDIQDEDQFLVNITGGTKIMSLAAYNFFTKIGASDIFYLPIGKSHFRQIFPIKKNKTKEILFRIDLKQYLEANGVAVQPKAFMQKNQMVRSKEQNETIMQGFLGEANLPIKKMGDYFRRNKLRDKKKVAITEEVKQEIQPVIELGFEPSDWGKFTRDETNYLTGDWFEEYVYVAVKEALGKNEDEIGKGVRVTRGEKTSNEFDVMFTHNNTLYVIECKTDVADDEEGKLSQLFTNTLYKASTLKKDFGLYVKYFLFSINDFSRLSAEHQDRARVLDIKLVGTEVLANKETLSNYIKKM